MTSLRCVWAVAVLALTCACARDPRPLVVALGDSITYGEGLKSPSTENYAARYAARTDARLVDLAVSGYRCVDVLNDEVPKMPPNASVVIVNCGTNDIGGYGRNKAGLPDGRVPGRLADAAGFAYAQKALKLTLDAIRAKEPAANVYLVNLRHFQRMGGSEAPLFAKEVDKWNAWLKTLGPHVVDFSDDPRMYRPENFQPDVVHPNAAGSEAMASDVHS